MGPAHQNRITAPFDRDAIRPARARKRAIGCGRLVRGGSSGRDAAVRGASGWTKERADGIVTSHRPAGEYVRAQETPTFAPTSCTYYGIKELGLHVASTASLGRER